jgi:hypothetical protein
MNWQLEDGAASSGCHIFHIVQSHPRTSSLDNQESVPSESYYKKTDILFVPHFA